MCINKQITMQKLCQRQKEIKVNNNKNKWNDVRTRREREHARIILSGYSDACAALTPTQRRSSRVKEWKRERSFLNESDSCGFVELLLPAYLSVCVCVCVMHFSLALFAHTFSAYSHCCCLCWRRCIASISISAGIGSASRYTLVPWTWAA